MALKINEIKSIIIKDPGKPTESIKVIYELGTTDGDILVNTESLRISGTPGSDSLSKIKSDAMVESKRRHGIT